LLHSGLKYTLKLETLRTKLGIHFESHPYEVNH